MKITAARLRTHLRHTMTDLREYRHRFAVRRGVRVSVITPVFNAMPYLTELLTSLDVQGLRRGQLQVIMIDDGSTDGSAAVLDAFAASRDHVTVLHQPNSGWPGQPRNRGLDLARGRWVFFADADDYLAPDALREMADFGDRLDAQVVLPRVRKFGTRHGAAKFDHTLDSVSKRQAFRTFTPHKLIRRELIETAGLRFPEGKIRLEDGILLTRCYLLAQRISVLADRNLYYFRGRSDGQNISAQHPDAEQYVASLERILATIDELSRGPKMRQLLVAETLRRKSLTRCRRDRLGRWSEASQRQWLAAHSRLLAEHITPEVRRLLSARDRRRCDLIIAGDLAAVLASFHGRSDRTLVAA